MSTKNITTKGLSTMLALILIFSLALPAFAEGLGSGTKADPFVTDAVFSIGSTIANAGDEGITLTVLVEECPAFAAIGLEFAYNTAALTLTDIKQGKDLPYGGFTVGTYPPENTVLNGIVIIDYNGDITLPKENAEILTLEFSIDPDAAGDEYEIQIGLSDAAWVNYATQYLTATAFNSGTITVTESPDRGVCTYDGEGYLTINEAIDAIMGDNGTGTITMTKNSTIEDYDHRIIIPDGADITLDMNGKTITSQIPKGAYSNPSRMLEIEEGAKLNLVDHSVSGGGGFLHETAPDDNACLANFGTLNMSNIKIDNFYHGIVDGSEAKGNAGTYGTIEDCTFITGGGTAMYLGSGQVDTIVDCTFESGGRAVLLGGGSNDNVGKINLIQDCKIELKEENWIPQIMMNENAEIETIKDCVYLGDYIKLYGDGGYGIDVNEGARIGLIEGGSYTGDAIQIMVNEGGIIETLFDVKVICYTSNAIRNDGTIGNIIDCELESHGSAALYNGGGHIDNISGGEYISLGSHGVSNYNGTIENITGGIFHSDIRNGLINDGGSIDTISGGVFTSDENHGLYNYEGTIQNIVAGEFSSNETSGMGFKGGTIDKITGGVYIGNESALLLAYEEGQRVIGWSDWETDEDGNWYRDPIYEDHIFISTLESLEGGYFKTVTNSDWIVIEDGSTCVSPEGYNLSTVPMRPEDFGGKEGFYHFGQTANVTWDIDGNVTVDKFVIGDPVYYYYDQPTKEGDEGVDFRFKGWHDGTVQYNPNQTLPVALEGGVTYTAVFEQIGSEEDYQVYLETEVENINAGEEFTVDVIVSSEGNENFYGATVVIGYDKDMVEFDSSHTTYYGFNSYADGNTETTRGISGGQESGYTLVDGSYKIASIGFKAKTTIDSGKTKAIFSIEDNPVVDQQMGFASIGVEKGEDITVNLYNLTVTFTTGENITMGDVIAYVRYDEEGLYADNDYEETFVEPSPEVADHYTFKGWKLGNEYFSFEDIKDMTFTENTTFVATATPGEYTIDLPDCVEIISGVEDDQIIIHGTDVVFTVTAAEGYQVNKVTYTVGEGEAEEIELVDGKYTIPGEKVTGNITVNVTQHIAGSIEFIAGQEFNSLPADHQLLVLTVADKLDGSAYEYNEDSMFYSSKYSEDGEQVYLYIVPNDVTEAEAREAIQITEGPTCYELRYDGDINLDGKVISTDAVIVFALYQGLWEDKSFPVTSKENMQARLEADVNGDKVVDTTDAQKILDIIWGNLD